MLVVNRFRARPGDDAARLQGDLETVLGLLAGRPGYVAGRIGRNVDEPDLWALVTVWDGAGAYRRALSTHEFKMHGLPIMLGALDESSAYEVVDPDSVLNVAEPRVT